MTTKQYSWANGLSTQITGKGLVNVNDATDDATMILRTISNDAYTVAKLISTFNNSIVLPNFSNISTFPNNFLSNLRYNMDMLNGAVLNSSNQTWLDIVYMYRFLKGVLYVPTNGEYFLLHDAIMASQPKISYSNLYALAIPTIPYSSRITTDLFFQTQLFLPNAPASGFYPITDLATMAQFSQYTDTSYNPPADPSGSTLDHSDELAALSISRVNGVYILKGEIQGNFLDGVTLVGSSIVNSSSASQFLAHAMLTGKLVGGTVVVDASDVKKLAAAPGAGVSMVYSALPPFGAPTTTYFGFQITNVLSLKFCDDHDVTGSPLQTVAFSFNVIDNPVVATAPMLTGYQGADGPLMTCADYALRIRFALTVNNFLKP